MTITSVGSVPVLDAGTVAPCQEGCTFAPLAANASCYFTGSNASVYGGGLAKVKGSTKNLRGTCTLYNAVSGAALVSEPMR